MGQAGDFKARLLRCRHDFGAQSSAASGRSDQFGGTVVLPLGEQRREVVSALSQGPKRAYPWRRVCEGMLTADSSGQVTAIDRQNHAVHK